MSGSTGRRGGGGSIPPGRAEESCDKLDVTTLLNSPVPVVIANLKKGDILDVLLRKSRGITRLEAVDPNGQVAGSLTPNELLQIVKCIEAGYKYVATLTGNPSGGAVKVRVRTKRKTSHD